MSDRTLVWFKSRPLIPTKQASISQRANHPRAKGEASSGQRGSCNDVPLVMRLLTREWHALGERSMDDPEYEEAIKACL